MEDDLQPAGEEASDNEGDEDNEEYETMTVTDVGDNFNEQVRVDLISIPPCSERYFISLPKLVTV